MTYIDKYAEFIHAYNGYITEREGGLISGEDWQWLVDKLRGDWIEAHGTVPPR
jgi:hypothetical protein